MDFLEGSVFFESKFMALIISIKVAIGT